MPCSHDLMDIVKNKSSVSKQLFHHHWWLISILAIDRLYNRIEDTAGLTDIEVVNFGEMDYDNRPFIDPPAKRPRKDGPTTKTGRILTAAEREDRGAPGEKQIRACTKCRKVGHNSRSCPNGEVAREHLEAKVRESELDRMGERVGFRE